jgi:hypothetical protein
VFAQIGVPSGGRSASIPRSLRPLLKYNGLELPEPTLVFCDRRGTGTSTDTHPIRGVVANRPYDYPLTLKGLAPSLRVGVVCPASEAPLLRSYLQKINQAHRPADSERDYLVDYPGFQQAYALPIEIPELGMPGWIVCAESSGTDGRSGVQSLSHSTSLSQLKHCAHLMRRMSSSSSSLAAGTTFAPTAMMMSVSMCMTS